MTSAAPINLPAPVPDGTAARHPAAAVADGPELLQLPGPSGRLRDDRQDRRVVPPDQVRVGLARVRQPDGVRPRVVDLGPDRRPHRPAQGDLHRRRALERRDDRLGAVAVVLDVARSAARWSASARARTAPAPTRCCAPPRHPKSAAARSASTTSAWRSGRPAASCSATCWRATIGWRNVFWIAGGPSILLAACAAFVAAPARLPRPADAAGARLPPGPDVSASRSRAASWRRSAPAR